MSLLNVSFVGKFILLAISRYKQRGNRPRSAKVISRFDFRRPRMVISLLITRNRQYALGDSVIMY